MRNGGFWFKVKVLSFKIRFCNGDSDAHLTPTTAHAQTLKNGDKTTYRLFRKSSSLNRSGNVCRG